MEIARAAAGLFMTHGLRGTRAEDIARAAGVAPRTFYRYFAAKEEALGPLFSAGAQKWAEAVRDAPADLSVPEALQHAIAATLTPGVGVRPESLEWVRNLLRLAERSPALLRVWGEACQAAERELARVLAARVAGAGAGTSYAVGGGTSYAVGGGTSYAVGGGGGAGDNDANGVGAEAGAGPEALPVSPGLRLSAAVASAAVRVAVEAWAAGDDPPDGPASPAALAARNVASLRDFPWSAV